MANPSPGAVTLVRSWVSDWTPSDSAIAAALNAATVANPVAVAPVVSAPFAAADVFGAIGSASCKAVLALPSFDGTIQPLLDAPDPKSPDTLRRLNQWAAGLTKAGILQPAEFDLLAAPTPGTTAGAPTGLFNRFAADPNWAAQIPRPLATIGRLLDAADIAASRPGG